jgi:4-hydroxy-tetrahydrodipicolinate reductase
MKTSSPKIRLIINGCRGRMGTLLVEEALKQPSVFDLVGVTEYAEHPEIGKPLPQKPALKISGSLKPLLAKADLIVEFTTIESTLCHAREAAAAKVAMVIGTTGFSSDQFEQLKKYAKQTPIFWSPNMSIGIVIIRRTIAAVSQLLQQFGLSEKTHIQLSETHHTKKLDKPSGTAKALAQQIFQSTGWLIKDEEIEARREGDVVGIHSVVFECPSENLTLTHEATDRRVFAQGALLIAQNLQKISNKKAGWITMDDAVTALQKKMKS